MIEKTNDFSKLFEEYPEAEKGYDYESNPNPHQYAYPSGINITESDLEISYICKEDHNYSYTLKEISEGKCGCERCRNGEVHEVGKWPYFYASYNKEKIKKKRLEWRHPRIFENMHINYLNRLKLVHNTFIQMDEKECGHKYRTTLSELYSNNDDCLICSGTITVPGVNTLDIILPKHEKYYSSNNIISYSSLTIGSMNKVEWNCLECGSVFIYTPREASCKIIPDHKWCPYCRGTELKDGYNNLYLYDSSLEECFLDTNDIDFKKVPFNYPKPLDWRCKLCGGNYKDFAFELFSHINNCPYCNNKMTLQGFNDLPTTHPELARRYSKRNELPVTEIRFNTPGIFYWNCDFCGGEIFETIEDFYEHCDSKHKCCELNETLNKSEDKWSEQENAFIMDKNYSLLHPRKKGFYICHICNTKYLQSVNDKILLIKQDKIECPTCRYKRNGNVTHII